MGHFSNFNKYRNIKHLKSLENNINESKVYSAKGLTLSKLEKILKKEKEIEIITGSGTSSWYITPYMHNKGRLEDADQESFFAIDKDGEEREIYFEDVVSYIIN